MSKSKAVAAVAALILSVSNLAVAGEKDHDSAPRHGGIVSVVNDVNYELVAKPDQITLYIIDHGKPVDTKGASATLTLLSSAGKSEVMLSPAGENKLHASGSFKVDKGTKVAGTVTTGGKPQNVRFTIK